MPWLYDVAEHLETFWRQASAIWKSGGWGMAAIAVDALLLFAVGMHVYLKLRSKGFRTVPESAWRHWINHPQERRGPIGFLLDLATGGHTLAESATFFEGLRMAELAPIQRDLRLMKICVSAAPLLGLLGTVTGMLTTFAALATGSGGDRTMAMIAEGISQALVTTETGLVVALPGLFFQYQLNRTFERYQAFLAHLESVCTQKLYRRLRREQAVTVAAAPA